MSMGREDGSGADISGGRCSQSSSAKLRLPEGSLRPARQEFKLSAWFFENSALAVCIRRS